MAAKKNEEQKKIEADAKIKLAAEKKAAKEVADKAKADAKEIADKEKAEKKAQEDKAKADAEASNENDGKEDPEAEKPKDDAPKLPKEKVTPSATIEGVRVKSLVSMVNFDGTQMIPGQMCSLSHSEHARLKKDARGPFFEE